MKKKSNVYLPPGMTEADYKAIQKEWYGKLKQSGFEDIESFDASGEPFDVMKKDPFLDAKNNPEKYQQTFDYFNYARQFYNHYDFSTEFDSKLKKLVWKHHKEGASNLRIFKRLKGKITQYQVNMIVDHLREKLKMYIEQNR